MAARAAGTVSPPFGQFPYMEVDGVPIGQSLTCIRYAAKLAGLVPADATKAAIVESVIDQLQDVAAAAYGAAFAPGTDEEKAKAKAAVIADKVPGLLKGLVAYRAANAAAGPFLFGADVTAADIMLNAFADSFMTYGMDLVSAAPELRGVVDAVGAHPALQSYFATRATVEAAEKA
jgi:glutathione S-transferase